MGTAGAGAVMEGGPDRAAAAMGSDRLEVVMGAVSKVAVGRAAMGYEGVGPAAQTCPRRSCSTARVATASITRQPHAGHVVVSHPAPEDPLRNH